MRTILVVVRGVGLNDVIQLSEAKTEELIQALAFKASDPRFDEAICDGCLVGSPNRATIRAAKILVEALGELAVTVMDQEPHIDRFLLSPHAYIPGLLLHPFSRGVAGTW